MGIFDGLRKTLGLASDETALRASLATQLDAIEAEMRRINWWSATPIEPERMHFTQAFGADTMSYASWLQFVFVPNARGLVTGGHALPAQSMVAAQAVREFDGQDEALPLCSLLTTFDQTVGTRRVPRA